MAAGRAAELGARVLLLEKMGRVGIKLALTGKGRCNLTNGGDLPPSSKATATTENSSTTSSPASSTTTFFPSSRSEAFPRWKRGEEGCSPPPTGLRTWSGLEGIRFFPRGPDLGPRSGPRDSSGERPGWRGENRFRGHGSAPGYPGHGRMHLLPNGIHRGWLPDGRALGHTLQPLRPSLVPLETEERYVRDLQGLSLKNVRATLLASGQKVEEEFGEMLFTHFGVSGPIILTLSGRAVDELGRGKVEFSIDFKPALSPEQVDRRLLREFEAGAKRRSSIFYPTFCPRGWFPFSCGGRSYRLTGRGEKSARKRERKSCTCSRTGGLPCGRPGHGRSDRHRRRGHGEGDSSATLNQGSSAVFISAGK